MLTLRSPSWWQRQRSCPPCPSFCRSLYLGIQALHQLTRFIWVWCSVSTESQEEDSKRRENRSQLSSLSCASQELGISHMELEQQTELGEEAANASHCSQDSLLHLSFMTVHCSSHQPLGSVKSLNCGQTKMKCVVSVAHILDLKTLCKK